MQLIGMDLRIGKFQKMWIFALVFTLLAVLSACAVDMERRVDTNDEDTKLAQSPNESIKSSTTAARPAEISGQTEDSPFPEVTFGYTYHRPDGNRLVSGKGSLPESAFVDVPLDGQPVWVVGAASGDSSLWAVALADGRVQAFSLFAGQLQKIDIKPDRLPAGMPPLLKVDNGTPELVISGDENASQLSHAVPLDRHGDLIAFINVSGDVVIDRGGIETARLQVNALPDARLLVDEKGRILVLNKPTDRYGHGVLGDRVEAAGIAVLETQPNARLVRQIDIYEPAVVEGITPFWTDLNADGEREIIVTHSDASQGAGLVVYNQDGAIIAAGSSIGMGNRWRNQLGAAQFDTGGEIEIVDVRTPHLTGVVEFFNWDENELKTAAELPGYTSHVIGTRNLDMGLIGDFDGDGVNEVLLPNQERTELAAVFRMEMGAVQDWSIPLDGVLSSNLAAVTMPDNRIILAAGLESGILRIWK